MKQELRLVCMENGREKVLSVKFYSNAVERHHLIEKMRHQAHIWNAMGFVETSIREDGHLVSVSPS